MKFIRKIFEEYLKEKHARMEKVSIYSDFFIFALEL